jgi:UDP-GlcNAc:undecaprenyl-phosphate GlcNAc-1-phosphate transferase
MFLGFCLAVTSVRGSQKGPLLVAALVPLLVLGLPLLDTGAAVVRRVSRLRSQGAQTDDALRYVFRNLTQVFQADRGHIHHCLLDAGMSHSRAVLVLYGVGTVFAVCAFALVLFKSLAIALLLIGILTLLMAALLLPLYLGGWKLEADAAQESPVEKPESAPSGEVLSSSQVRADTR